MTERKKYADPESFRRALETRLNNFAKEKNTDLERLRKQVAFDRLLARIFADLEKSPWRLKGGYALELRFFGLARATKDIDLSMLKPGTMGPDARMQDKIREALQDAADRDTGDWFQFLIKSHVMELDAAPYGGARYPVEVRLAGHDAEGDAHHAARAGAHHGAQRLVGQRRQAMIGAQPIGGAGQVGGAVDQRAVEVEQHRIEAPVQAALRHAIR